MNNSFLLKQTYKSLGFFLHINILTSSDIGYPLSAYKLDQTFGRSFIARPKCNFSYV